MAVAEDSLLRVPPSGSTWIPKGCFVAEDSALLLSRSGTVRSNSANGRASSERAAAAAGLALVVGAGTNRAGSGSGIAWVGVGIGSEAGTDGGTYFVGMVGAFCG